MQYLPACTVHEIGKVISDAIALAIEGEGSA